MTKYCRYHHNHGHTIKECKALHDKIEELVRAGHFRRFIRSDDHSSSSQSRHPLDPTTGALHMTPVTTDAPSNPPTKSPNQPAPTSPLSILPYVAPSTPSLVASLVEDPLILPERDTSAISNPSTISSIPTTDAACLLSSSQMTTFMASTINKMTPWSSVLKSKTMSSRKSLLIRAAPLTSSTGPPTKNFNFRTPLWSRMTSRSMASLANKYPLEATSTCTPSFVRGPKPKSSQSASLSSTRQHPTISS